MSDVTLSQQVASVIKNWPIPLKMYETAFCVIAVR